MDKTFAHFAGDMRENEMIVRQRNPKHRPGQNCRNRAF
jgi:hypothetical protein